MKTDDPGINSRSAGVLPERAEPPDASLLDTVLDAARWAPSGDNVQPWRFDRTGSASAAIVVADLAEHDIHEYGVPTLLATGMAIENAALQAGMFGARLDWTHRGRSDHGSYLFDIALTPDATTAPDPLFEEVRRRSVDRRPYRLTAISTSTRAALESMIGPELDVTWYDTARQRYRLAGLHAGAAQIFLGIPEAHAIYRERIDCKNRLSIEGLPLYSLPLDPITRRVMSIALQSWPIARVTNALGGAALRFELQTLPSLLCGAHFAISTSTGGVNQDDPSTVVDAGRRLGRFWLEISRLGLAMQPATSTLALARHGARGSDFTKSKRALSRSRRLASQTSAAYGRELEDLLFVGRIGVPRPRRRPSRSLRRPLHELRVEKQPE